MKPIYFPFTYCSKPVAEAFSACFKQVIVYQPSRHNTPAELQQRAESGIIGIRVPVSGQEKKIAAILKDYNVWAHHHQGGTLDFLKAWSGKIPFFDETFSSQIRADIKKKSSAVKSGKEPEGIFSARLFLHIAQEFDLQNIGLNQDLRLLEVMEQNLIKDLKGADEALHLEATAKEKFPIQDPGLYMTTERLEAWSKLMQQDRQTSGLFITTSRSVFDELIDRRPALEMVIDLDSIPVHAGPSEAAEKWQDGFLESLHMLQTSPGPVSTDGMLQPPMAGGCKNVVSMKLYMVAGETPYDFFAPWVEKDSLPAGGETEEMRVKNTLIGLMEL